jgi:cytochrome c peroxidase
VLLGSPDLMAGLPGNGPLTVSAIVAWLDDSANHAPLEIKIKKGHSAQPEMYTNGVLVAH